MGTNVANLLFPLATEPIVQSGRVHLHIILFASGTLFETRLMVYPVYCAESLCIIKGRKPGRTQV